MPQEKHIAILKPWTGDLFWPWIPEVAFNSKDGAWHSWLNDRSNSSVKKWSLEATPCPPNESNFCRELFYDAVCCGCQLTGPAEDEQDHGLCLVTELWLQRCVDADQILVGHGLAGWDVQFRFNSIGIQQPFIQIDGWKFWFVQSHFQAFWHFQFKFFDDFQASENGHWCFSGLSLFEVLFIDFFHTFWTLFLDCFSGLKKKGNLVQCFVGTRNMRFCCAQWAASVGSAGCRKVAVLSILIILWIDIRSTETDGSWQCLKMCGCMSILGRAWSH